MQIQITIVVGVIGWLASLLMETNRQMRVWRLHDAA
jgi:hypothetical protein